MTGPRNRETPNSYTHGNVQPEMAERVAVLEARLAAAERVVEAARNLAVHVPNGKASDPYKADLYRVLASFDRVAARSQGDTDG